MSNAVAIVTLNTRRFYGLAKVFPPPIGGAEGFESSSAWNYAQHCSAIGELQIAVRKMAGAERSSQERGSYT